MDAKSSDIFQIREFVTQVFKFFRMCFQDVLVAFFAAHHAPNPEKLGFTTHKFGDKRFAGDASFLYTDFNDVFFEPANFVDNLTHNLREVINLARNEADFHQFA